MRLGADSDVLIPVPLPSAQQDKRVMSSCTAWIGDFQAGQKSNETMHPWPPLLGTTSLLGELYVMEIFLVWALMSSTLLTQAPYAFRTLASMVEL